MKLDAKNDPTIRDFENWVKDKLHGMRTEQPSTTQVSETGSNYYANYQQSRTARYPAKVLAELLETGEINREQYERLRRESIDRDEPPAPRAGERERVILNSDLVVRPMPNTLLKTKYLLTTDDDWPVAEFYREEEAEGIAYEHNQYAILIEQRDRLFIAAKFLLAMNTTNYDRDAMRSEGGFDALQKAVDYAIEQSRNSATTIEREGV